LRQSGHVDLERTIFFPPGALNKGLRGAPQPHLPTTGFLAASNTKNHGTDTRQQEFDGVDDLPDLAGKIRSLVTVTLKRRDFIKAIAGSTAAWPIAARAQQPPVRTIGWLSPRSSDTENNVAGFRKARATWPRSGEA
jgi:hypothetical protein